MAPQAALRTIDSLACELPALQHAHPRAVAELVGCAVPISAASMKESASSDALMDLSTEASSDKGDDGIESQCQAEAGKTRRRPCKGQRRKYRLYLNRVKSQLVKSQGEIDLENIDLPLSIARDPVTKAKFMAILMEELNEERAQQEVPEARKTCASVGSDTPTTSPSIASSAASDRDSDSMDPPSPRHSANGDDEVMKIDLAESLGMTMSLGQMSLSTSGPMGFAGQNDQEPWFLTQYFGRVHIVA
jgi:hypothetical protein